VTRRSLVVIGAGPLGLAAALGALQRGHEVVVLEKDRVGASLFRWGHARFFTPVAMNVTAAMAAAAGRAMPAAGALVDGPTFVASILEPAAAALGERVHTGARVVAVGRARLRRGDHPGHPVRGERGFRILVESGGTESVVEADAVLDASGVYDNPAWMGTGGLPALGERQAGHAILRDLGSVAAQLTELAGRRVLIVGHGHSAAHAIRWLRPLAEVGTTVVWATRSAHRRPVVEIASDPLPERAEVAHDANELAARPPSWLRVERTAHVESVRPVDDGWTVELTGGRTVGANHVIALVGHHPDLSFLSELALEVSPVTEGAARLARVFAHVTDCLSVPAVASHDLDSGEPGFHVVGAKSYGRASTFLLRTGFDHLATILDNLTSVGGER
jgi:thioredoxin reductase